MKKNSDSKLYYQGRISPINIDFFDLSYALPKRKIAPKLILENVSGKFRSGQLSAILGPSGSGKTTLLNILAGYKFQQTAGTILINGKKQEIDKFRNISRYIMQENWIQPFFSVKECMMVAASLKMGNNAKTSVKLQVVLEILDLLRLSTSEDTHTDRLSGGELKRLFIALELISHPSILFLDEPTTGLDDVAAYQCIDLLKQLAEAGRTIICSIHAPSARLFSCFHHSYFISGGQCVYQGCGSQLVPFLSSMEAPCPVHFNPVDYILDLCSGDYKHLEQQMVSVVENGKNLYENGVFVPIEASELNQMEMFEEEESKLENSFWIEFKILLLRMWLLQWRNKPYLFVKVIGSTAIAVFVGIAYINLAQDATKTHFSFTFYHSCLITFMYIPLMPLLLEVPTDMKYLKREYFNKWYNIKSYFFALNLSTIPDQIIFASFFSTTVYILTGQPLELHRILGFYGIFFLIQNITEAYGVIIGSSFTSLTNAGFCGVVIITPFVISATLGYGEEFVNISIFTKILMYSSYLRYGFEAVVVVMLSGRKLKCPEDAEFCMYADQDYFLKNMALDQTLVWLNILVLVILLIVLKYLSYHFLKQRFQPNSFLKKLKSYIKLTIRN